MLRRNDVAASNAASLASVPDVVRKTLASGIPDSADSFSAISTIGALRYSVERVQHLAGLLADRVDDLRHVVTADRREDAAEEVEVLVAVRVPDVPAFTAHQLDRFVVVEREPARHDRPMTVEQLVFGVAHGCTSPS